MDMGDILAQWDKIQTQEKKNQKEAKKNNSTNQISHKKPNAPTLEEKKEAKAREEQKNFARQIQNENSKELAAARRAEKDFEAQMRTENSKEVNPMELWLRKYGTIDKDKIAEENQVRTKEQDRNYLINLKPEAHIDLHGLHQDEARERLNLFITECKRRGLRKIMIIHGKGIHTHGTDPVLGELVRRFIETDNRCGMSGHPKNKAEGGTGATWVILK